MFAWCKILYNLLKINNDFLEIIVHSDNLFKDVYMNEMIYLSLLPYVDMHIVIFKLLNKYDTYYCQSKVSKYDIYNTNNSLFFCKTKQMKQTELENLFEKTQHIYCTLSKFVNFCKRKFSKIRVTTDLELNEINVKSKMTLSIYQKNSIYYFTIRDLINICNSALVFSHDFFSEPHMPKNPYTNEPFEFGILLKIYNAIRYSNYKMPILLELFYKENFNIDAFLIKYELIIRNECINHFMKNGLTDEKCEYIYEIMHIHLKKGVNKLTIDDEFPKDVLIKAFDPILYNYLLSEYSLISSQKKWQKRCIMKYMLYKFVENNPLFGRKKYILCNGKTKYKNFITDYISVDKTITIPKDKFLNKQFLLYINEYESESESESESEDNQDETSIADTINSFGDIQITSSSNISDIISENNETNSVTNIFTDDLFKNESESEWDDLINDTDSVS